RSTGTSSFLWAMTACTATAHSTASTTDGNSRSTHRGLHEASPVLRHECIGNLAVFAECAGSADLVEAHEPRVARHVSGHYCCQPASNPAWSLLLHGQAAPAAFARWMPPAPSLSLGAGRVNKWNPWLPERKARWHRLCSRSKCAARKGADRPRGECQRFAYGS